MVHVVVVLVLVVACKYWVVFQKMVMSYVSVVSVVVVPSQVDHRGQLVAMCVVRLFQDV